MDQLIFASLSHTHYWYEVGMLKVPAIIIHFIVSSSIIIIIIITIILIIDVINNENNNNIKQFRTGGPKLLDLRN